MTSDTLADRWAMLPGPEWETPLQARTWLVEQRRLLGWSHKDVAKAFFACAVNSDLYTGPGGGDRFDRATEKRAARFEREGQHIPDWMYWIPLAIKHHQVPFEDRSDWERQNIPEHSDLRREREEDEYQAHVFDLSDDEIEVITRYRAMDGDLRTAFLFLADPATLKWLAASAARAAEKNTTVEEALEKGLGSMPRDAER
ncbi:hypothetical protein [Sphingomonas sp.]|jgi:hypothetical protein|uniref:hypothetical protein n=1 Tax=Sphingomonas sp. TaxID=28214 RepID=UPI003562FE48